MRHQTFTFRNERQTYEITIVMSHITRIVWQDERVDSVGKKIPPCAEVHLDDGHSVTVWGDDDRNKLCIALGWKQ